MPMPSDRATAHLATLRSLQREARCFYYGWFFVYAVLGLAAIVLPGLAAMGVGAGADDAKYLAGGGALAASLFGFLKPNQYLAAFDTALAEIGSLQDRIELFEDDAAGNVLRSIRLLMAFNYQGMPGPSTTAPVPPTRHL